MATTETSEQVSFWGLSKDFTNLPEGSIFFKDNGTIQDSSGHTVPIAIMYIKDKGGKEWRIANYSIEELVEAFVNNPKYINDLLEHSPYFRLNIENAIAAVIEKYLRIRFENDNFYGETLNKNNHDSVDFYIADSDDLVSRDFELIRKAEIKEWTSSEIAANENLKGTFRVKDDAIKIAGLDTAAYKKDTDFVPSTYQGGLDG